MPLDYERTETVIGQPIALGDYGGDVFKTVLIGLSEGGCIGRILRLKPGGIRGRIDVPRRHLRAVIANLEALDAAMAKHEAQRIAKAPAGPGRAPGHVEGRGC